MPIVLQVTKLTDDAWSREYRFDEVETDRIVLGRDSGNQVVLVDPLSKISRHHAEIRLDGEAIVLLDTSANGTFLNDEKMEPGKRYPLGHGDNFSLGEYCFALSLEEKVQAQERTQVYDNPFHEECKLLAGALQQLEIKFHPEISFDERALKVALEDALREVEGGAAVALIAQVLAGGQEQPAKEPAAIRASRHDMNGIIPEGEAVQQVLDIALETVVEIAQNAAAVGQDYCGMVEEKGTDDQQMSVAGLKVHLLDSSLATYYRNERFEQFKQRLDKLARHPKALFSGYRQAVKYGVGQILEELDPEILERGLRRQASFFKRLLSFIPLVGTYLAHRELKQGWHQLLAENLQDVEAKVKPHFIRAYLNTLRK